MKIAFFTRSMNYALFLRMKRTLDLPYVHHRYLYTTGDGYFFRMLKSDADIAINIDEDAFVSDNHRLKNLLEYFLDNRYVQCGMPDGGVVPTRHGNPIVANPFFNILDLRVIRENFQKKRLDGYRTWKSEWESRFPAHLIHLPYRTDEFECYYPFLVWIGVNYPTLYLDARVHEDGISTILLDHENRPFLLHSWFSREYGIMPEHTERINALFRECCPDAGRDGFDSPRDRRKMEREKLFFSYGFKNYLRMCTMRKSVQRKFMKLFSH